MVFYTLTVLISLLIAFTVWFVFSSFRERAFRAFFLGLVLTTLMASSLIGYLWATHQGIFDGTLPRVLQAMLAIGTILFGVALFLPLGRNRSALAGTKGMKTGRVEGFNQKDTAFNIAHVGGYGPEVAKLRWSLQSQDPFAGFYWNLCMGLRKQVDGPVHPEKRAGGASKEVTKKIKEMARYLGADLVGVTSTKEDFVYSGCFSYEESKLEEGPAVTHPPNLAHKTVIVLAKEMDHAKVQTTLTDRNEENEGEVGKTYYEVARIACALASHIRHLGYSARAHHLRNEAIFQVPHAIDAGLGEQGRFNYLITAKYGPRVRLASVTTDLELEEDSPVDIGVQDFCTLCRLCEHNCPSQAISEEKTVIRGYLKWPQAQERCFRFWVSGQNTFDCSLCMKICPWNKPATFVHRVSFFAASRSALARRMLYWMAVVFYGRRVRWQRRPHHEGSGPRHRNPRAVHTIQQEGGRDEEDHISGVRRGGIPGSGPSGPQ